MSSNTTDNDLVTVVLIVIGAIVLLPVLLMVLAPIGIGPMMGGMWAGEMAPGWVIFMGVLMQLLFVGALIGGGYLIFRTIIQSDEQSDEALEELRLAYARGELSDEEFQRRKEALNRES